jgi:hypothetical protein
MQDRPGRAWQPGAELPVDAVLLIAELVTTPEKTLCPDCAASRLAVDKWDVMQSVRQLVVAGRVKCGVGDCPSCASRKLLIVVRDDDGTSGGQTGSVRSIPQRPKD